ncbi:MAG: hypothetical protein IPK82_20645 [Polyangiaceae bacterium]|nr:hypothetical protein [Polyangiaceae bacterium]
MRRIFSTDLNGMSGGAVKLSGDPLNGDPLVHWFRRLAPTAVLGRKPC